jgi:uncharacterized protein
VRFLPLHNAGSGRSAMTCQYRCGNACDHPAPNQSDNPYFGDMVNAEMSRRGVVRAGVLGAVTTALVGGGVVGVPAPALAAPVDDEAVPLDVEAFRSGAPQSGPSRLTFKPIPPNRLDTFIVPNGYDHAVVIRWGDEVIPGAPALDVRRQTGQSQSKQFGYNNDFTAVLPLDRGFRRALLWANHEYTNEELMFPGFTNLDALTVEQIRAAIAAHGGSIVELERVERTGEWQLVRGGRRPYNRRITALSTRFTLTGAAAGSPLLRTAADPTGRTVIGMLNNCAGGVTPWGTILTGEENFNQYFVGGDAAPADIKPALARYGITTTARYPSGSRKWERADSRFDLAVTPNEAHRFGYIVEVDPYDPDSTPRKHTALGRFKHEGANVIVARSGHVAAYMGDDERFDYMYKFVSDKRIDRGRGQAARRHNMSLLESGTLYVARFAFTSASEIDGSGRLPSDGAFNGTGRWIPLVRGSQSLVPGMSVDQVLIFTRLAGDQVGATKMDRPEDVEPNLRSGKIYAALTNNTNRGAAGQPGPDEVNPRTNNKFGHILEITEDGGDHTSETFTWNLPIVCGDPADPSTYFMGFDKSRVSPIACPDNVAFDGAGNLWISTDSANAMNQNDGLFAVPLEGPERGYLRQFLSVPVGAETCGPFITQDGKSVFVAVQHPGEISGATLDNPASTWPDGDFAKPSIVCTWRLDGRQIGT